MSSQEPFGGWTAEGLGIAIRMEAGEFAADGKPGRGRRLTIAIGVGTLLTAVTLALLGWAVYRMRQPNARSEG